MIPARQVAYKVWISDLINAEYFKQDGEWESNYFLVRNKKVSRVNVVSTVIDKYLQDDNSYGYLEVDDGSAKIRIKAWREDVNFLEDVNIGDVILLIGRSRKYNEEVYVTPEIINVITNLNWVKFRKLELEKEYGKPTKVFMERPVAIGITKVIEEEKKDVSSSSIKKRILDLINQKEEIGYDDLVSKSGLKKEETDSVIKELVKGGEIFFPRPQYIRSV